MQNWPDLRKILADVDWVIVGAVATRAYMPERKTRELDILVRETDATKVIDMLQNAGFRPRHRLALPRYTFRSPNGVNINVFFGAQPWLEEALAQGATDPAGYPVLPLPYLVLMKLESGGTRDMEDITTMLGWADEEALSAVRQAVAQYRPADSQDLQSLIYLGRLEREQH